MGREGLVLALPGMCQPFRRCGEPVDPYTVLSVPQNMEKMLLRPASVAIPKLEVGHAGIFSVLSGTGSNAEGSAGSLHPLDHIAEVQSPPQHLQWFKLYTRV